MKNNKAETINFLGWIDIIGGIIGSFILGSLYPQISVSSYSSYVDKEYNWILVIVGITISIVSGIILIGFAEIINLLQQKADQSENITKILSDINSKLEVDKKININNYDELPQL